MIVKVPKENLMTKAIKFENKNFLKTLANGYLQAEKAKRNKILNEYINAYNNLQDKDSFNGQYLETLIYELKNEI
ncbi:MAG: hypothetical protein P8Y70_05025 [Candidatus Lokiarchaeota archaeon]